MLWFYCEDNQVGVFHGVSIIDYGIDSVFLLQQFAAYLTYIANHHILWRSHLFRQKTSNHRFPHSPTANECYPCSALFHDILSFSFSYRCYDATTMFTTLRSEERRVGKGGRSRG